MLTYFQSQVIDFLASETMLVTLGSNDGHNSKERLTVAAGYAFALFHDLASSGHALEFSDVMIKNRGLLPQQPFFFRHTHVLEELAMQLSGLTRSASNSLHTRS